MPCPFPLHRTPYPLPLTPYPLPLTPYPLPALFTFPPPPFILPLPSLSTAQGTLGFVSQVTYSTVPELPHKASAFMVFPSIEAACTAAAVSE